MKRILPVIGTVVLACASQGALALDSDAVLDQFPSARSSTAVDVQQARRGARTEYGSIPREFHGGREERFEPHSAGRYRSHGSFVEVSALGGSVERGAFYGTAGTANGGGNGVTGSVADLAALAAAINSALGIGDPAAKAPGRGAKVLHIETDRLDRRPYGPDGLDVVYSGSSKIIRISPDFGRPKTAETEGEAVDAPAPVAEAVPEVPPAAVYPDTDMSERPVDPPAEERRAEIQAPAPVVAPVPAAAPRAEAGSPLEPWTPEWLRDCVSRYPTFDASLGTYRNESGQRRFCTGEP